MMFKLKKAEKDKLRRAIKKKRRKMRGKKLSIKQQAAQKKERLLKLFKPQIKPIAPIEKKRSLETSNGVTPDPSLNNPDYVEFEDLKPDYQEIVEKFIKTDRDYMRQLKEEEEQEHRQDADLAVEELPEQQEIKKEKKLSKRKLKQLKRIPVAQLKVLVDRPDLVESWDVTAKDPLLLMWLKSYKNTVVVPKHWSQKRKFLQNKRGKINIQTIRLILRIDEENVQITRFY